MKYTFRFCALVCLWTSLSYAQLDSIQKLDEVFIVDRQIERFSTGQLLRKISDSILKETPGMLTDVLQQNTPIFFKQNGYGMVSSPAFRGTTAQQTAVVWNGFNINSQLNGQTDFNTLLVDGFDQLLVRPGGGSVIYGTGAIGGSIHLNNELRFDGLTKATLSARVGSFSTFQNLVKAKTSTESWSLSVALSRFSSQNDYDWPGTNRENLNGEFEHYNANLSLSYNLNKTNRISYHGMYFNGDRNFSLVFPNDAPSGYTNEDHRHLLEWESEVKQLTSVLKLAFFDEFYEFTPDQRSPSPDGGSVQTTWARYSLFYTYKAFDFNILTDFNHSSASGDNLREEDRNIASFALLTRHHWQDLTSEIGVRQEYSNVYDSPFLFNAGLNYKFSKHFSSKVNASKNFRIPTFNDLFWEGRGRTNLLPETSNQVEGSLIFSEGKDQHLLSITGYYNDITNLIRWVPNLINVWQPENVDAVETYGVEANLKTQCAYGQHRLKLNSLYAYTISENQATGFQLTYVPKHKWTNTLNYSFGRMGLHIQNLYNSEVFTRANNSAGDVLEAYSLWNAGWSYTFPTFQGLKLSAQVRNIGDIAYQTVENRPLPGRHFFIQTLINF